MKTVALRNGGEPRFFSQQITEARRFFLRLTPPWPEGFNVVCGGSEHCAADYEVVRKHFHYFVVEFVASGEGLLVMNEKTYPLMTGAVFVYSPKTAYEMRCRSEKPMTKYFVAFAGSQVRNRLLPPAPKPGEIAQSSAPEHIVEILEGLIDAGQRETPFRERICRAIGEHLLLRLAETSVTLGTIGTQAFDTYQRCRRWIAENYRQIEDLPVVASMCNVDRAYLCRLFKRFAHKSPWQYVLQLKMRDAAHRLQSSDLRVRDVAYEFGFADPFQFSRTFHRILGVSPRQFKRLQQRSQ
jgi:AraC-like DNA-binding protein